MRLKWRSRLGVNRRSASAPAPNAMQTGHPKVARVALLLDGADYFLSDFSISFSDASSLRSSNVNEAELMQ